MAINLELIDYIKPNYNQNHTYNFHFREITAAFYLCSGVAICHYILKLGVLLVLNSPLNRELVFTVKTPLNMNFIFLLTAPFRMTLDETCFTKHSYAIGILFYTIRLKK